MFARSLVCAAAFAVLVPAASLAAIIVPTFVSGTNVNSDSALGFDPMNTTTNDGLSFAVGNGDALVAAQAATFSQTDFTQYWETLSNAPYYFDGNAALSLVFDLGANTDLSSLVMWQSFGGNDNQLSTFTISYSSDGVSFGGASEFTLDEITTDGDPAPAQTFALGAVNARFVQLALLNNYYGTIGIGGDRVGFGKIRFDGVAAVPVSSTWLLMIAGFGLAGAALRHRRANFA
jgi:hypothetical protein